MTTGAIVAGGRSTRFGDRDKAVAELAGVPMIRRVADRLAGTDDPVPPGATRAAGGDPLVGEVVINCRPDQREAIDAALAGFPLPVTWAVDDETVRSRTTARTFTNVNARDVLAEATAAIAEATETGDADDRE